MLQILIMHSQNTAIPKMNALAFKKSRPYLNLDGATDVLHGCSAGNCEGHPAPHHVSHGRCRVGIEKVEREAGWIKG